MWLKGSPEGNGKQIDSFYGDARDGYNQLKKNL